MADGAKANTYLNTALARINAKKAAATARSDGDRFYITRYA